MQEDSGLIFIVSGQQVIISKVVEDKIVTLMEYNPNEKLSVEQRVIPLKGSTAEQA